MSFPRSIAKAVLEEKEWPVEIYRRTMRGWEKQIPFRKNGQSAMITAIPREGCIIVRKLRLRICLTNNSKKDSVNCDGNSSRLVVVRRGDMILISSNRRVRALILKFCSTVDCHSFSDHLIAYNPPPALSARSVVTNNIIDDLHHQDEKTQRDKMIQAEKLNDHHSNNKAVDISANNNNISGDGSDKNSCSNKKSLKNEADQQKREVFSYIVRLLHDKDFVSFVNSIETCLASSLDGNKIIQALADPDLHPGK